MNHSAFLVALLVIAAFLFDSTRAEDPPSSKPPVQAAADGSIRLGSEKWQQLLDARQRHEKETIRLRREGQLAEAIAACDKMLATERQLWASLQDDKTPPAEAQRRQLELDIIEALKQLGQMQAQREDFVAARQAWEDVWLLRRALLGEQHWQVIDARLALADVNFREKLSADQRQKLGQAEQWHRQSLKEHSQSKLKEAVDLQRQVLQVRHEVLGPEHPDVAVTCQNLGFLFSEAGVWESAANLYREALRIRERRMGKTHPQYGETQESLADVLQRRSAEFVDKEQFTDAVIALGEALALRADRFGADDWRARELRVDLTQAAKLATLTADQRKELADARMLNAEAVRLYGEKKYEAASEKAVQALEIRQKLLGENSPDTFTSRKNVAVMADELGDSTRAEQLYRDNLKGRASEYGIDHPQTNRAIEQLADFLGTRASRVAQQEQWEQAVVLRREVLQLRTLLLGENHWKVTDARDRLADIEWLMQSSPEQRLKLKEAEELVAQAWKMIGGGKYSDAVDLANSAGRHYAELRSKANRNYGHCLSISALGLRLSGDLTRAETTIREALHLLNTSIGEKHPESAGGLGGLANILLDAGRPAEAEPLAAKALAILESTTGERDVGFVNCLRIRAAALTELGNYVQAEDAFLRARELAKKVGGERDQVFAVVLDGLGRNCHLRGKLTEAESYLREAMAIFKEALGEQHLAYAASLHNLALLYREQGRFAEAEKIFTRNILYVKQNLGEQHPQHIASLTSLAIIYRSQGKFAKAYALIVQSLDIQKRRAGERSVSFALTLNSLATLFAEVGLYAEAHALFEEAIIILVDLVGEDHPHFVMVLTNLAGLYHAQGDPSAMDVSRRAVAKAKAAFGDQHVFYAKILGNDAVARMQFGSIKEATPRFRDVLAIEQRMLGESHPDTLMTLANLASASLSEKKIDDAIQLLRPALETVKRAHGTQHPLYSHCASLLANCYLRQGQFDSAEKLYRECLVITRTLYGQRHKHVIQATTSLALTLEKLNRDQEAAELFRLAVKDSLELLNQTAAGQSERQQLVMGRHLKTQLEMLLSHITRSKADPSEVYEGWLAWKGMVFARQRALREAADQPALKPMLEQLITVRSQLAQLTLSTPDVARGDEFLKHVGELVVEQEILERALASAAGEGVLKATRSITLAELRASLPIDAVLIDFIEYEHHLVSATGQSDSEEWEGRLVAFLIARDQPPQLVELGPVKRIAELIDTWRSNIVRGGGGLLATDHGQATSHEKESVTAPPQYELRRLIWEPFADRLKEAKLVLVALDGTLVRCPLTALPGKEPGKYLLEEVPLASVPVPRLLPEMLQSIAAPAADKRLVVIGDVDFDAVPGQSESVTGAADSEPFQQFVSKKVVRGGKKLHFEPLPGTVTELDSVQMLFKKQFPEGRIDILRKGDATEAKVSAASRQAAYLHLATHGYFAPPDVAAMSSTLTGDERLRFGLATGQHPLLLSGLALAGANRDFHGKLNGPQEDDGVLTAMEVSNLDLRSTEVVVLSACETGLGAQVGFEGIQGLQRSFLAAGAKTTVTSLWQIPDNPTRILMEQFYAKLWRDHGDQPFGKLEALREAQLWMLHQGRNHPSMQRSLSRGLVRNDDLKSVPDGKLPPYFWAAFVLSGDWR